MNDNENLICFGYERIMKIIKNSKHKISHVSPHTTSTTHGCTHSDAGSTIAKSVYTEYKERK